MPSETTIKAREYISRGYRDWKILLIFAKGKSFLVEINIYTGYVVVSVSKDGSWKPFFIKPSFRTAMRILKSGKLNENDSKRS